MRERKSLNGGHVMWVYKGSQLSKFALSPHPSKMICALDVWLSRRHTVV